MLICNILVNICWNYFTFEIHRFFVVRFSELTFFVARALKICDRAHFFPRTSIKLRKNQMLMCTRTVLRILFIYFFYYNIFFNKTISIFKNTVSGLFLICSIKQIFFIFEWSIRAYFEKLLSKTLKERLR